jgi:peptidoglycan/LPS O-acetylase OafA/YrhL
MRPRRDTDGVRSTPARLPYQPALDGLRGAAVAAVLLYHAGYSWIPGGFLGVSTFFTLSGFLITSLLRREVRDTGRIALGAFWERRFRRLMPAAFSAIALAAAYGALFADDDQLRHLRGDALAALAYGVNWWFILSRREYADIFASPSPVQHFWSLAIEEQYYLLFPLLFWVVSRAGRGTERTLTAALALLGAASVATMYCLLGTDAPTARLYYGTDTRAAELLGGALLAMFLGSPGAWPTSRYPGLISTLGCAGILVTATCWWGLHQADTTLYAGGLLAYTFASLAILASAVLPGGPVRALLSLPPMVGLGRVSYGLYLYHFPIFLALTTDRTGLGEPWLTILRLSISLALANLSLRWLETPIRSGTIVVGRQRFVLPPILLGALVLSLFAVTAGRTGPVSASLRPAGTTSPPIPNGPDHGQVRVLVVGDSVGDNVGQALQRWSETDPRLQIILETRRGCGLARGGEERQRDAKLRADLCAAWVASWSETVARVRPNIVVVYTGGWDLVERRLPSWPDARTIGDPLFDEWLRSQYREAIATLTSTGARVVWLSSLCVKSRHFAPDGVFDPSRVRFLNSLLIDLLAGQSPRAAYLDLYSQVCPGGEFADTVLGITDGRPDGVHFTEAAGDRVADWIARRLLDEMPHGHSSSAVPGPTVRTESR